MFRAIFPILALSLPVFAQQGDRRGHDNMEPVVPEELIPEAPVRTPAQALETFELADGFILEPVAAEPLVEKPVALDFDAAGHMWVCEMPGYMPDIDGRGESVPQGSIVVLKDTDGDGAADQREVFLDEILMPRAIRVYLDGILFLDQNRLMWAPRDGGRRTGEIEVIDPDFAKGGNVEHKPNGLMPNLDNWNYLAKSDRRIRRTADGWKIAKTSFRGQWGIARDDWGRLYHNNNSTLLFGDHVVPDLVRGNSAVNTKVREASQLGSNRVWPIRVTPGLNRAYMDRRNGYSRQTLDPETHKLINATAAAGLTLYRGTNFPDSWQGTAFVSESGVQLVKAIDIAENDGRLEGSHRYDDREFLASTDERFRPVNLYNAPDGSLYLLDFYHGIIQHKTYMTSYLREQTLSRDLHEPARGHGRIYRIRHRDGDLETAPDIAALEGRELLKLLAHPNAWHRETAQRVIVEAGGEELVPDLTLLTKRGDDRTRAHAIWSLEGLGVLNAGHLVEALENGSPKLRQSALWAATRLSPDQLVLLAPTLAALEVESETRPYLARALAECPTPEAHDALAALLETHGKQSFVRQAAVAGLAGKEQRFLDEHLGENGDDQLVAWLEQGAKGNEPRRADGGLQGPELESFARGKVLYHGEAACIGCHGADGAGLPNLGPPLDESKWVTGDPEVLVKILLHGMTGPIEVAGETYNPPAAMPGLSFNPSMTDQRLADISTYVRREWNNDAAVVKKNDVAKIRAATDDRAGRPYTAEELD
jgi:glucose/arabinose dehydrogenase/mono/diheme cytochrome c family protein